MTKIVNLNAYRSSPQCVFFDRSDLNQLLSLYSQYVSKGVWRDYAMGASEGMATFSVFRRSTDGPVYTVIKYAAEGDGQSEYVVCRSGRRLKRGSTLGAVLDLFEPKLELVGSIPAARPPIRRSERDHHRPT